MANTDTKALLRTRFSELRKERDTVEKKLTPLREKLKAVRAENAEAEAAIAGKIKAAAAPLAEIDAELASISHGLMGKTGAEV
jgi:predicted  nucleic acid-binding Zn-ribbon protein